VQKLSVNGEPPQQPSNNRRRSNRPQLLAVVASGGKRNRPTPPPLSQPVSCRVNAKDDGYFVDWPNKENTPGNAVNRREDDHQANQALGTNDESTMGSNLSRHSGKGLTGRRTQSSGNLCDPKGKLNSMGKILVPCSSAQRERSVIDESFLNPSNFTFRQFSNPSNRMGNLNREALTLMTLSSFLLISSRANLTLTRCYLFR
jgi:hypothetical protein